MMWVCVIGVLKSYICRLYLKHIKIYQSYLKGTYVYFEYIQVVFHIYTKHIKAILHVYPMFFIPTQTNILVLLLLY
jgi:hypothetical protein